jgi:hypothetical protein
MQYRDLSEVYFDQNKEILKQGSWANSFSFW